MLMSVLAAAAIGATVQPQPQPRARIILVGDSTLATRSGYGDELCKRIQSLDSTVQCVNLAKGGESSSSYRAAGYWSSVQALLRDGKVAGPTYVLIEFGHNDQPNHPGRSTNLQTEFPSNLKGYATDVRAVGGLPVLVTPLSRRYFRTLNGQWVLYRELEPWAEATRKAGVAYNVPVLDLYTQTASAVQAMGEKNADTLAMGPAPNPPLPRLEGGFAPDGPTPFDHTHLGQRGAVWAADIMMKVIKRDLPSLDAVLQPRKPKTQP